jgi:hypothetical protein
MSDADQVMQADPTGADRSSSQRGGGGGARKRGGAPRVIRVISEAVFDQFAAGRSRVSRGCALVIARRRFVFQPSPRQ